MKTEYEGTEVSYIEGTNSWEFELRGRHRTVNSLAAAKEAIDKVPAEKRKPFPKFDAYFFSYSGVSVVTAVVETMKKMKNGDSFLFPITKRGHLSFCAKKAKIVISTRTVDGQTIRCWRIKERPVPAGVE